MNKFDRAKIINAGFTILRIDDTHKPAIKQLTNSQNWKTWKEYPTKAARDRDVSRIAEYELNMIFD
jgi:hypothetical protein